MTGKRDEARALLEDLVRKSPTPDVHARLGDLLAAEGRAKEAGASTRWLRPPGGATHPSRRIWRDSSPSAAKRSTKR